MIKTRPEMTRWAGCCSDGPSAVRWQLADIDGQSVPQTDGVRKEGLTVDVCVALDLHVLCFKSSSASRNWLKVPSSRSGDKIIILRMRYSIRTLLRALSLLERLPLQLLQHSWDTRCTLVVMTGEACCTPLYCPNLVDIMLHTVTVFPQ